MRIQSARHQKTISQDGESTRQQRRRRGAAAVEFAIVAPLLFLIFFASVEFSRLNMMRHTVDIAAYEGARLGIIPGASVADVRTRVNEVLAPVGIRNVQINVTPTVINSDTPRITVAVQAPMVNNGFTFTRFTTNRVATSQATLVREGFTTLNGN